MAGGAEDQERQEQTAWREAQEELGTKIPEDRLIALETVGSIPRYHFSEPWPASVLMIPEYAFAVDCSGLDLNPVQEHDRHQWVCPELAWSALAYDSNRSALWELCQRLGFSLECPS